MLLNDSFLIIQKLKCLCRVSLNHFLYSHKPVNYVLILICFYYKSIDLVDGIIQLYKSNLDECAQALIRILFETNLKYTEFQKFLVNYGDDEALCRVLDSMMIVKEKHTQAQDKACETNLFGLALGNIQQIKEKYSDKEFKKISDKGFTGKSTVELAEEQNKNKEYQVMYRNFSRNIHGEDFAEYCNKQISISNINNINCRNDNAYAFTFNIFINMMKDMNVLLKLNIDENLKNIINEYHNINK